jgi:hypothetical protein
MSEEEYNAKGDLTPLALRRYKTMLKLTIEFFQSHGLLFPDKMSARQAALYMDLDIKTLERRRAKNTSPPFYKDPNTGAVYYIKREIDQYLGFPEAPSKVTEAREAFTVIRKLFSVYRIGSKSLGKD